MSKPTFKVLPVPMSFLNDAVGGEDTGATIGGGGAVGAIGGALTSIGGAGGAGGGTGAGALESGAGASSGGVCDQARPVPTRATATNTTSEVRASIFTSWGD